MNSNNTVSQASFCLPKASFCLPKTGSQWMRPSVTIQLEDLASTLGVKG